MNMRPCTLGMAGLAHALCAAAQPVMTHAPASRARRFQRCLWS